LDYFDRTGDLVKPVNLLGMALLRLLAERPQHPYELRQRMRDQGLDRMIKVTHGALYYSVESLVKAELIAPVEVSRQGRRPERTVYEITDAGRDVAGDRLRELLSTVAPEPSAYGAALALLSLLAPADAARRLELRAVLLEGELAAAGTRHDALIEQGVAPIALVEMRHHHAHLRADLELTRSICDDIRRGRMNWEPVLGPADGSER
jgi:DNA-binding PadR family transcriptional regulator